MKVFSDIEPRQFQFWSSARKRADSLTSEDWDKIEPMLEDMFPDGVEDGKFNDFFWFEFDTIAQWLGYKDEEDMDMKRDPHYEPAECDHCSEEYDFTGACYSPITKGHYCCGDCQEEAEAEFFEEHEDMSAEVIPSWALCYLVNGDASGLTDEEIETIKAWIERTGFVDLEVLHYESGDVYTHFSHHPAFGLPTEVTDCIVRFNNDNEE